MTAYRFTRRNRSLRAILTLACVYAALAALIVVFDAVWWVVTPLALCTLPALWDILRDTTAGLTLGPDDLQWHSGRRSGAILLKEIRFFRFDTGWDMAVHVRVILVSGKTIRLPDEATPPHRAFESVLQSHGFKVERHHFTGFRNDRN